MPPYSVYSHSSSHPTANHRSQLYGQHGGVPMPPPSVTKDDDETGSISYTTHGMDHITLDGQTKISALDDPTLVTNCTPNSNSMIDYERNLAADEAKARVWSSIRRKVCCSLLFLVALITGVVLLLRSFGDAPLPPTTSVIASSASNATTTTPILEDPTYGGDTNDDFFNEPNGGVPVGQNFPQSVNAASGGNNGPIASAQGPPPPPAPQQGDGNNNDGDGDGDGCRGGRDNRGQQSQSMTKGGGGGGGGKWWGGGGGGGRGGGGCRDGNRGGGGGGRRLGGGGGGRGGRCGCRDRDNDGGGDRDGVNRGGGGNRRTLSEYLFGQ